MAQPFTSIGYTKKSYGSKGEVKVVIEASYIEDLLQADVVFIEIQGKPAPFFIEYFRETTDLIVKLEEVDSPEAARAITSRSIFLRDSDIREHASITESDLQYKKYEGYLLCDVESGEVGLIEEVQEFPQQEMAIVNHNGHVVYIPLHKDLIESVNEAQKTITLRLPEGLLSV